MKSEVHQEIVECGRMCYSIVRCSIDVVIEIERETIIVEAWIAQGGGKPQMSGKMSCSIHINPLKILAERSPLLYGQFLEHFHRQIYGGHL